MGDLTAHFSRSELVKASVRTPTDAQIAKGKRLCELVEPSRAKLGFPVYITSFIRDSGSGVHKYGDAGDFGVAGNKRSDVDALFDDMRFHLPKSSYGKIINERTHVHVTLPGAQGAVGLVYLEPVEGEYTLLSSVAIVVLGGTVGLIILIGLILYLSLGRKA
jgi:hypothetical protein